MIGLWTRVFLILALILGLLGSNLAYSQAKSNLTQTAVTQKIGYADMKIIFDNAPQVVAGRDALDREFRPRNDAVLADEKRLAALQERLTDNLDANTKAQLDRRTSD